MQSAGRRVAEPVVGSSGARQENRRPRNTPQPTSGRDTAGKRVLIVDDNEDAAAMLGDLLTHLGHNVAITHTSSAALELAEIFRPQVALLDLRLPSMDGYELAWRLRNNTSEKIRLIAVTGYGPSSDRERLLRAGFEAFLIKPVTLQQVESFLKSV